MQSLPAGGKYRRDDLVAQCMSNSSRVDELVAELDNLEGNAGEIAAAILQVRIVALRCEEEPLPCSR